MHAIELTNLGMRFKIGEGIKDKLLPDYLLTNPAKVVWALKNVSFKVKKGEFLGIIGENGAGKSTLLKILAGIINETEGLVSIYGKVSPFLELGVGLEPEFDGKENAKLYASILGIPWEIIKPHVEDIFQFAGLEGFEEVKIKKYSTGMKLRLAFSIALFSNHDIFLIDEVFGVGDESFKNRCLKKLKQLKKDGKTLVFVSHDLNLIKKFCDKSILLEKGRLKRYGPTDKVIQSYLEQVYSKRDEEISEKLLAKIKTQENQTDFKKAEKKIIQLVKKAPELKWGSRWGSDEVEIKYVKCLDSNNKEKYSYKGDEQLKVEIGYFAKKTVKNPEFGIALYDSENNLLLNSNTTIANKRIKKVSGEGSVFCTIPPLPLKKGFYELSVAVCKERGPAYDHKHKIKKIKIDNKKSCDGTLVLPCDWTSVK